jgi:regulator of replication initiation timing
MSGCQRLQDITKVVYIFNFSEHAYAMPSTVESIGRKLAETKKTLTSLVGKNASLKNRNSKLKKRVKTLQGALKGTVTHNLQT